eukprot:1072695_1
MEECILSHSACKMTQVLDRMSSSSACTRIRAIPYDTNSPMNRTILHRHYIRIQHCSWHYILDIVFSTRKRDSEWVTNSQISSGWFKIFHMQTHSVFAIHLQTKFDEHGRYKCHAIDSIIWMHLSQLNYDKDKETQMSYPSFMKNET